MISENIFKAYDIRGLYPQEINKESIDSIGKALSSIWETGIIVIAHDGRHGSKELSQTLIESIKDKEQFEIKFVGLSTTPMFYFLVNHLQATGGAIITASHNPKEYNGVKAVNKKAIPISGTQILSKIKEKNYDN